MATYDEHWQAAMRLLQEIEKLPVVVEIIKESEWEVRFEQADVEESLDIDKGPICVSYACDLLPVAIGTAWKMFQREVAKG